MIRIFIAACALAMAAPAGFTQDEINEAAAMIGPEIGAAAPAFAAVTSAGEAADLAAISGEMGAVLVFSRSLDWCPYCKKQALELETISGALSEAGWNLSLITYDDPETLANFATDGPVSYTLLSDTGSAMIDAFGLRNTEVTAGSRFDGIPHPAIIFVSSDGSVAGVLREDGYRDRPENNDVLAMATSLSAAETDR